MLMMFNASFAKGDLARPDTPTWRRCSSGALTLKLAFGRCCEDLQHPIDAICVVYWMSIVFLFLSPITYHLRALLDIREFNDNPPTGAIASSSSFWVVMVLTKEPYNWRLFGDPSWTMIGWSCWLGESVPGSCHSQNDCKSGKKRQK